MLILLVGRSKAQTQIDYRFTAALDQRSVFMSIAIKAGSICQGILIERSTDSIQFSEIGSIAGVCGSSTADVRYTFTDISPVPNSTNYYRLRFGENGFSEVVSVLYVELLNNFKLFPNPANRVATLWFSNTNRENYSLLVVDATGKIVWQQSGIKDNKISLEVASFLPGIYFFQLSSTTGQTIKGKLVVAH